MLSPDQIDDIYNFIQKRFEKTGKLPLRKTLKTVFCPDVSKYKDKVLIRMSCDFWRGGNWSDNKLIDKKYWDLIQDDPYYEQTEMYLGEVNGKHSEVIRKFGDIFDEAVTDPYEIYDIARHEYISEMYGDPPEEDDDFLRNFQDIFDFSCYEDQIFLVFKYKDKNWSVLLNKTYEEDMDGDIWIKDITVEDGVTKTLESILDDEIENPINIASYVLEYGDPEDESFFEKDFDYQEFFINI